MTDPRRGGVCPRLVDYLCIVGAKSLPLRPHHAQTPELLAKYPPQDHKVIGNESAKHPKYLPAVAVGHQLHIQKNRRLQLLFSIGQLKFVDYNC